MRARLSVISYKNQPPESALEVSIEEGGGSIGRAPGNLFVLPDPDRFISGKHAEIAFQNDRFFITDTSTNGLYLGNNTKPLGRDNSTELVSGQQLAIGDYIIEVTIESEPAGVAQRPAEPSSDSASLKEIFDQPVERTIPPWLADDKESSSTTDNASVTPRITPPEEQPSIKNDFFTQESELISSQPEQEYPGASEPDNVPAESQFFSSPETSGGIPEDWDILSDATPETKLKPLQKPIAKPQPKRSESSTAAVKHLLKGARLDHLQIPEDQAEALLESAGKLLRDSLDGLMQMLRARTEVKSEFRMKQTTIRPAENNPLKFSATVEDALQQMLTPVNKAYLPPDRALKEALEDIDAHQLAIMAGIQATLTIMLKRFDPEMLKAGFDHISGRSLLESKKAWYWEQYEEKYREIQTDAQDHFHNLFGEEFAKAYQEQVDKISQGRDSQK